MPILRRRSTSPATTPPATPESAPADPPATKAAHKAQKRATAGAKPAIAITGPIDKTDYRAIVRRYQEKVKNPKTAIRAKCVECSGGSLKEVQMCRVVDCALFPFRMGINPFNKKTQARLAGADPDHFDADAEAEADHDDDDDDEGAADE